MLTAILRRKTGRSGLHRAIDPDDDSVEPDDADASAYEDPLTAAVFERLSYLDDQIAWSLPLKHAELIAGAAPPSPSGPLTYRFWPHWRHPDSGRVEPDVVIENEDVRLVVEAKHNTGHTLWQWDRQVSAAVGQGPGGVWLLAVGAEVPAVSINALTERGAKGVLHLRWRRLGRAVRAAHATAVGPQRRILADIAAALAHAGYGPRTEWSTLHHYRPAADLTRASLPRWR